MKKITYLIVALLILFQSYAEDKKTSIKKIIVFGDSLSDTGNYYRASKDTAKPMPLPPYMNYRVTNGSVWVEFLAKNSATQLENYAYLGAMTKGVNPRYPLAKDLRTQVNEYLPKMKNEKLKHEEILYVVWAGANNIFNINPDKPFDTFVELSRISYDVKKVLTQLINSGAKNLLVGNLPDFSKIALMNDVKDFQDKKTFFKYLTNTENFLIWTALTFVNKFYNDKINNLYLFDANKILEQIHDKPEIYGLKNVTNSCYMGVPNTPPKPNVACNKPSEYLFWDLVHPSTKVHCFASLELQKELHKLALLKDVPVDAMSICSKL